MENTATRRQVEIQEVDGRLQQEYENRLAESLQQIRDENSEIIRRNREEVEAFYEKRVYTDFHHPTSSHVFVMRIAYFHSLIIA